MRAVWMVALVALVGCSSIRDREITVANAEEVLREIAQSRDLTPDEAQLVGAYVARNRLGETLGLAVDATLPATVAQAIERHGRFVFLDTFGTEVSAIAVGVEEDIGPGQTYASVFTKDYNQFIAEDRALRGFDLARGTVRWEPAQVVYVDRTQVRIPEG